MARRALLSVSDKTGIDDFGQALAARGWQLLSTGGTARRLRDAGLEVTEVAEATGHPEMMDGRVKTLHPAIHGGLLARRDRPDDMDALASHGYAPIDLVAVNLYPFRETVAHGDVPVGQAMEKVDIGGPTMIRAAAKNHRDVWVVVDPSDYARVLDAIDRDGDSAPLRCELARKVFEHISAYDSAIAAYLAEKEGSDEGEGGELAETLSPALERVQTLRYGENPGQEASFYRYDGTCEGIAALEQIHGKELSYNNILDLDGALLSLSPFAYLHAPAVCIIKHTTPCGLAVAETLVGAYKLALRCDPVSSFGSVIAVNRVVDEAAAEEMSGLFIECLVAPGFEDGAVSILTQKKNIRMLIAPGVTESLDTDPVGAVWWVDATDEVRAACRFLAAHGRRPQSLGLRSVSGGVLAQTPSPVPFFGVDHPDWRSVTERPPTEEEDRDLAFAWAAVYGVKSNAILLVQDCATLGIGAGQMSRVDSSRIAVQKAADAGLDLEGAVLASDAFFPFRDGVDAAAGAGVRAIVQPGGSKRDDEVIEAANEHGMAMVFTGQRLFRH
jgi:phosphoribosylaminoimidazolecarboxamide formyltransferase / IMP cyclohydrolase